MMSPQHAANARSEPPRLLPLAGVLDRVGISKTTLYELIRTNQFPAPIKVRRCARWLAADVDSFVLVAAGKAAGAQPAHHG